MTDPGFRVEGVQQGAPFRTRASFYGFYLFGDQESAVLVEPGIAKQLRAAAADAWPHETGGLLSGRALCDGMGDFVVVSGFVEAPAGSGRTATFEISPQATARLREEACRHDPTADVVGWWHTHLGPSDYSSTDRDSQRIWTQPQSVGLLVFARGTSWGIAHLGPDARRLGHRGFLQPGSAAGQDRPAGTAGQEQHGPAAQGAGPAPPAWAGSSRRGDAEERPPRQRLVLVVAVLAIVLFLAIILITLNTVEGIPGLISSGHRQLSDQIGAAQGSLGTQINAVRAGVQPQPEITWGCFQQPKNVYACSAATASSSPKVTYTWSLGGRQIGSGPAISFGAPRSRTGLRMCAQDSADSRSWCWGLTIQPS